MMKKVISLILTGAMVLSLAACGSSGTSQTEGSGDAAATDEVAEGERVLRVGLDVEPTAMDPNSMSDGQGGMFCMFSIYGTLWMMTTDGNTNMVLAESYEFETDDEGVNTGLTIKLRDDAYFSNGDPLTADDVIFSLTNSSEGTGAMRLAAIDIQNMTAVDDKTVYLPLLLDSPTLIEDLGLQYMLNKAYCEENPDTFGLEPVCSGAYIIDSWETGMGITLKKNEQYFGKDDVYYDEVNVDFVGSEDTRLLSFESGDYDIAFLTSSSSVDEINGGAREDASMVAAQIQSVTGFVMNTTDFDTFMDQNVRQAIGYAIDVPTLVETIMGSAYTVGTSMLPSSNWAYINTGNYDYDVEKAKELLAKSGYDENNRFAFTLTISDAGANAQLAEAIQAMLAQVNIDMSIDTQDGATFMTNMRNNQIEAGFSTYMGSYDPAGVVNARRISIPANNAAFDESNNIFFTDFTRDI